MARGLAGAVAGVGFDEEGGKSGQGAVLIQRIRNAGSLYGPPFLPSVAVCRPACRLLEVTSEAPWWRLRARGARGPMADDGLLEAVRGLHLVHPELGPKPLLAKLREQQPDLAAGNKEVREALAALKAVLP